jgi:hypothetical protein
MILLELKEKIDALMVLDPQRYSRLRVCIPNNKSGMMGGLPVTEVKGVGSGIDWDSGKFFIWPEKEMIEKSDPTTPG